MEGTRIDEVVAHLEDALHEARQDPDLVDLAAKIDRALVLADNIVHDGYRRETQYARRRRAWERDIRLRKRASTDE
jgi:hypothetical protein